MPAVDTAVDNFLDNVPFLAGDLDRLRRCRLLDALIVPRAELVDVEDGVNLQPVRQLELVVQVADLGEDLERSNWRGPSLGEG